jgi:hypothetical protein
MNMAEGTVDGYTLDDLKMAATDNRPPRNKAKTLVCPHCGKKGHSTMRSKKCLHHNGPPPTAVPAFASLPTVEEEEEEAAEATGGPVASAARNSLAQAIRDMDNYDSYPLQDDPPSDISLSAFEDAATWSEDEDETHLGAI